jgi:hypothetical protein
MIVSQPNLDGRFLYLEMCFPLDNKRANVGRFRELFKELASVVALRKGGS